MRRAPCHEVIERLNSLLRVELAAVAGYQKALRALKKKAVVDTDHILRLASDHQRTVDGSSGVRSGPRRRARDRGGSLGGLGRRRRSPARMRRRDWKTRSS